MYLYSLPIPPIIGGSSKQFSPSQASWSKSQAGGIHISGLVEGKQLASNEPLSTVPRQSSCPSIERYSGAPKKDFL